jgi:glycosyltransferase involved in cell wall biosynthesis
MCTRRAPRRWIKYAGNWQPAREDVLTYKFQRWILQRGFVRGIVTINGRWRAQAEYIHSFYNPSFSVEALSTMPPRNQFAFPVCLLFVGSINQTKGAGRALEIALRLLASGINLEMDVIGDGDLRSELQTRTMQAGWQGQIHFHGWLPRESVFRFYKRAHFILLPSRTEGWPKVLSEAMAYGVIPLAGNVSSIPQTLQEFKTGMVLNPYDIPAFVAAIHSYLEDPGRWERESGAARQAAKHFTYEAYLDHLRKIFAEAWQVEV